MQLLKDSFISDKENVVQTKKRLKSKSKEKITDVKEEERGGKEEERGIEKVSKIYIVKQNFIDLVYILSEKNLLSSITHIKKFFVIEDFND